MGIYYSSYLVYGLWLPDATVEDFEDETRYGGDPARYTLPDGYTYLNARFAPSGYTEGVVIAQRGRTLHVSDSAVGLVHDMQSDLDDFLPVNSAAYEAVLAGLAAVWQVEPRIGVYGVLTAG